MTRQAGRGGDPFQSDSGEDPDPFPLSVHGMNVSPWDPQGADTLMQDTSIQGIISARDTLGQKSQPALLELGQT